MWKRIYLVEVYFVSVRQSDKTSKRRGGSAAG